MKRFVFIATICLLSAACPGSALAVEVPQPVGLLPGNTSYTQALDNLKAKGWTCLA